MHLDVKLRAQGGVHRGWPYNRRFSSCTSKEMPQVKRGCMCIRCMCI
jgi:hypothetical protein